MKVHDPSTRSPLLAAAEAGADAQTVAMIEAARDAKGSRSLHREHRQAACDTRVKHLHAVADQLRRLGSKKLERACVGAAIGLGAAAVGTIGAACGAGPAAAQGAQLLGEIARGAYGLATAGDEEAIQERMKHQEAMAAAAQGDTDHYREAIAESTQVIGAMVSQVQRRADAERETDSSAAL